MNYSTFQNIFFQILNTDAPAKKNVQRFNINRFMTKHLRKAIMRRSRLKIIYDKKRSPENCYNSKKQRNIKFISKILVTIKNSGTQLPP